MSKELNTFALKALSIKHYSKAQLRKKLKAKFEDSENDIEDTLVEMESHKFLDDSALQDSILHQLASKGFGPLKMKQKIYSKGLEANEDKIKEYLPKATQNLLKKIQQRFPSFQMVDRMEMKERAKMERFIRSRGFLNIKGIFDIETE